VRAALRLPVTVTPVAVVPLGWPRGRYGPTTRQPAGSAMHLDRYGNRPYAGLGPDDLPAPKRSSRHR
jgi:hypothetical protein